ncbi:hypothetical protein PTT_13204 [Pyrenophora teres f. teres 0-1]|uniref:Uncharacterized protein n=1 Tax=Pyrenophora teres f. teres (strain 0-1) TaxID=861557 RepID=E3RVK3_PYRTT|nr:hypothetical protein PTT_13204 [Pyrenophora teres f. teres 0-1]
MPRKSGQLTRVASSLVLYVIVILILFFIGNNVVNLLLLRLVTIKGKSGVMLAVFLLILYYPYILHLSLNIAVTILLTLRRLIA